MAQLRGVVFDLDGVVTDTARLHQDAWESMFNEFLKKWSEREGKPYVPFDPDKDYHAYVDGKPRFEGVASFLESRGIDLPRGSEDDPPEAWTVCGLGNKKNEAFQEVLRRQGPERYDTSITFIKNLRAAGLKTGVASSSRNCSAVLELAGISDLFDAQVDGVVSKQLGLAGKPEPDIFIRAAKEMGFSPDCGVVVEDAISGVQAGADGGFGLTIGVARSVAPDLLREAGADVVVRDLEEISLDALKRKFEEKAAA